MFNLKQANSNAMHIPINQVISWRFLVCQQSHDQASAPPFRSRISNLGKWEDSTRRATMISDIIEQEQVNTTSTLNTLTSLQDVPTTS